MRTLDLIRATRGSTLSPTQRLVVIHVAYRAGEDGECWASAATLGEDSGFTEKTVRVALADLVGLGVLSVEQRKGQTAVYRLTGSVPAATTPEGGSDVPRKEVPGSKANPGRRFRGGSEGGSGVPRKEVPDPSEGGSDDHPHRLAPRGGPAGQEGETTTVHGPTATVVTHGPARKLVDMDAFVQLLRLQIDEGHEPNNGDRDLLQRYLRRHDPDDARRLWVAALDLGLRIPRWGVLLGEKLADLRAKAEVQSRRRPVLTQEIRDLTPRPAPPRTKRPP